MKGAVKYLSAVETPVSEVENNISLASDVDALGVGTIDSLLGTAEDGPEALHLIWLDLNIETVS